MDRVIDIPVAPSELPDVLPKDLVAGWTAATLAAERGLTAPAEARHGVRFQRPDGEEVRIVFADLDVSCWVTALDHAFGLDSLYGLAVCFRLLGLIDQMATQRWTRDYYTLGTADGPEIDRALLRAAARQPLTDDARFDPAAFRARMDREDGAGRLGRG
jgi:hypothetical protein